MARVITKDPDILGREPVFCGARVPFKLLTDYLEGGDTADQFSNSILVSAVNLLSPRLRKPD